MTLNLEREIATARGLLQQVEPDGASWQASGPDFTEWEDMLLALIRRVYGTDSQQESDYHARSSYSISRGWSCRVTRLGLYMKGSHLSPWIKCLAHLSANCAGMAFFPYERPIHEGSH